MADFNPKTIKGNIGGVYFTKTKAAVDPFNLTKYNPNTNQNIILFYLEDGVENNIVTVNFAPNDSSMAKKGWTSHDFPAIFRGYVDHTVNGEAIPRTFAQYLALVPTLITDLNLNNKKPLSFNATVIQQSGVNLLGSFNTLNDLINAHTPTESLHDNDAIAYVYENGQNGFYKVYFSSGSNTWYWGVYQGAISTSLSEVQYNLTGLQVQGGFRNPAPIVPLQDEQYRIIWQHLNELYAQYSVIEGELGELEQEIIELNTAVVKTISKTDTNTIIIGLTRIDNDVNIHAVVNVSSNSYNLLKVVGSDGLEVNPEDIINEIVFEINNTNSTLRQAIDDIVDSKITAHNINSEAHQDIRDDIETAEQNANEYTDEEVAKKVDLIANQNIGGTKNFTDFLNYKGRQVLTTETGNIYAQQIAELQDVKLNKIWADITEQATTNLTDILVFNRGSNVYKTTVANLLAQVDTQLYLVVAELPTTGNPNKIYLVPSSDPETQNTLDEFIWVDNDWEKIGAVSVDLSNYYNKTEINSMLDNKVDKNANITAGTHTKITYDEKGLVTGGSALAPSDIPNLDASKINAGTFTAERIPSLDASKISSGTFDAARIPNLAISKITSLQATLDTLETSKQDKLVAGDNITIDPTTNVISASGDGGYEPDGVTIVLNNSNELEVSKDLEVEWTKVVNKPTFSTVATTGNYNDLIGAPDLTTKLDKNFSTLPNQASPLLTDVLVINRGTVAQKTTLGNLLAQVDAEIFVVVATLPATGVVNKIYLLPKGTPESQDGYDEYIWVNNAWELIGSVKLDLSNYYNKTEVNGLLSAKVDKVSGKGLSTNDYTNTDKQSVEKIPTIEQDILDLENDKVDKVSGMGLSSNDFTTTEKNKLSGIQAGAQVNEVTTVAGRTGEVVLTKADVGLGSVQNYAIASKTQAESGTSNALYMTPLRTKELITVVMGDIESALDAILGV